MIDRFFFGFLFSFWYLSAKEERDFFFFSFESRLINLSVPIVEIIINGLVSKETVVVSKETVVVSKETVVVSKETVVLRR